MQLAFLVCVCVWVGVLLLLHPSYVFVATMSVISSIIVILTILPIVVIAIIGNIMA